MTINDWIKENKDFFHQKFPHPFSEEEWRTFRVGLSFIHGYPPARSFVTDANRYPVESRLSMLEGFLKQIGNRTVGEQRRNAEPKKETKKTKPNAQEKPKKEEPTEGKPSAEKQPNGKLSIVNSQLSIDAARHLDQYFHLLPKELQNRAQNIRGDYTLLTEYHNRAHQLFDDAHATQSQRKDIAEMVCHNDDKIRNFWAQVDAAKAKLTGKPLSDEEQTAIEKKAEEIAKREERGDGEWTYEELMQKKAEAVTPEELAQVEYLIKQRIENRKKYIRKPIQNTADHDVKIQMAVRELLQFGVKLSPKIREIALASGMTESQLTIDN